MANIQHEDAQKLLKIISSFVNDHRVLTYKTAAELLGRKPPESHSRAVAQMCDLLDAAAALAGVPLLALIVVRIGTGEINPKAWKEDSKLREAIIQKSLRHRFTNADFKAIVEALKKLEGKGNRAAWLYVRSRVTTNQLIGALAVPDQVESLDAIDDIGTDAPDRTKVIGWKYARNAQIRAAVMRRAKNKCEYCGELGFLRSDGLHYLECHHIIALAKDGADRMTNVIALCPNHHREAHFGERSAELEQEMIQSISSRRDLNK